MIGSNAFVLLLLLGIGRSRPGVRRKARLTDFPPLFSDRRNSAFLAFCLLACLLLTATDEGSRS